MSDELIEAIRKDPSNTELRLVYEDWLEQRGDLRAELLKLLRAMEGLTADHVQWTQCEQRVSWLRRGVAMRWLSVFEPAASPCMCSDPHGARPSNLELHRDRQDTSGSAWARIHQLIDEAAADGRPTFEPRSKMDPNDWSQLKTLPPAIAKLKHVRRLVLYGSALVRLPPEISEMTNLQEFTPYTSYGLHWYPYEITRCLSLRHSTVSTRSLYGNYKNRAPFPRLTPPRFTPLMPPAPRSCSVCKRIFEDRGEHRAWISLRVATDVLPLLVNACSLQCLERLPPGAPNHVSTWHRGGPEVEQPPPR